MRFQRVEEERPEIPTASTSDIVFLLLIFFMVSTVFKTEQGLQVELPSAMATKKVSMKHIAHICYARNIPTTYILIKCICPTKHKIHIIYT